MTEKEVKVEVPTKQIFELDITNPYRQPDYFVRESARAKHVRLRFSWTQGLEIVIPQGFDKRKIPQLIETKKVWLNRVQHRLRLKMQDLPADYFSLHPPLIRLLAIDRAYAVHYHTSGCKSLSLTETDYSINLSGPVDNISACINCLQEWLRSKAHEKLMPWLRQTSCKLNLPYDSALIRGQKTRWGSCSSNKVISLNYKLLFLPPAQVYYLIVHELCHTRHLNHSKQYWALVERKFPDFKRHETAMKESWRYVPLWVNQ